MKILILIIGFIFGVAGEYNAVKDDIRRAKTLDELKNKYKVIDI